MSVRSTPFLMWYDDSPKLSLGNKIADAIDAYYQRFRTHPTLVLVNEAELTEVAGVAVRSATNVRRHTYWVGLDESTEPTASPVPQPLPVTSPSPATNRRAGAASGRAVSRRR